MKINDYIWDIGLVLGTAFVAFLYRRYVAPYLFRKGAKKFFDFSSGDRVTIVIPTISDNNFAEREHISETTPLESVYVIRFLAPFLSRLLRRKHSVAIELSSMCGPHVISDNLVIIGGPINNECANNLLTSFDNVLNFEEYHLRSSVSGNTFDAEIVNGKILKDHTIVVSRKNPWNPKKHLIFIAACRGYGAIAASEFLVNGGYKDLLARAKQSKIKGAKISAVLSNKIAHFSNGSFKVSDIKIEEVHVEQ